MAAAAAVALRCLDHHRNRELIEQQEQQGQCHHQEQQNKKQKDSGGVIRASHCSDVQQSGAGECVRPRPSREDLRSHDFALWSNSSADARLSSLGSGNVGRFPRPRLRGGSQAQHTEFLEQQLQKQERLRKQREEEEAEDQQQESRHFVESMEDWPPSVSAAAAAAAAAAGGGIDRTIYQNLMEMIPLMESFMEQKGNRRQAAMVYTPTPARDGHFNRKIPVSPLNNAKKNKQQRPAHIKQQRQQLDSEEAPPVVWEEQENILRRVEDDSATDRLDEQLIQLQGQIDALQEKLQEKDSMLRATEAEARAEAARQEDLANLEAKIRELQHKVWDREQTSRSLERELTEKQQELVNTQSLVERMQIQLLKKNNAASSMAEELSELRTQVATCQYEAELRSIRLQEDVEDGIGEHDEESDEQTREMETARKMYLAAVIAAKEKPGAESITLAAELRRHLQSFVAMSPVF